MSSTREGSFSVARGELVKIRVGEPGGPYGFETFKIHTNVLKRHSRFVEGKLRCGGAVGGLKSPSPTKRKCSVSDAIGPTSKRARKTVEIEQVGDAEEFTTPTDVARDGDTLFSGYEAGNHGGTRRGEVKTKTTSYPPSRVIDLPHQRPEIMNYIFDRCYQDDPEVAGAVDAEDFLFLVRMLTATHELMMDELELLTGLAIQSSPLSGLDLPPTTINELLRSPSLQLVTNDDYDNPLVIDIAKQLHKVLHEKMLDDDDMETWYEGIGDKWPKAIARGGAPANLHDLTLNDSFREPAWVLT